VACFRYFRTPHLHIATQTIRAGSPRSVLCPHPAHAPGQKLHQPLLIDEADRRRFTAERQSKVLRISGQNSTQHIKTNILQNADANRCAVDRSAFRIWVILCAPLPSFVVPSHSRKIKKCGCASSRCATTGVFYARAGKTFLHDAGPRRN